MQQFAATDTSDAIDGRKSNANTTTPACFGVLLLMTRKKSSNIRSLWQTTASGKYITSPNCGSTCMSRYRFGQLMSALAFGDQTI